jgi:DNA-binding response OmpR family regulator
VSTSSLYSQKKIFILGAGVTGLACAHSLKSRDALVTLIDDSVTHVDGFEVVRRLRLRGDTIPVLLLTARDDVQDRVRGLELGADDYLVKPFAAPELVARLKALVRRSNPRPPEMQIGGLQLDAFAHLLCAQ